MNKQVTILLTIFLFVGGIVLFAAGKSQKKDIPLLNETQEVDGGTIEISMAPQKQQVTEETEKMNDTKPKTYTKTPDMQIDKSKDYTVLLNTSEGAITIALNAQQTPITANNFYSLAKDGFYDNVIFHRTIDGFMIQGGDPQGTGTGGPGYKFADEPFTGEYTRGTVAMANSGPNTNGSQFFIMHKDYPLPPNYVIFGTVTKGMEVVDAIATAPVKPGMSGENSTPVSPVKILSTQVVEK